ncbi:DMT family transporter [Litoreibacter albidus]|uniref:Permease of the drug/metabolite transporter (DMT) superfamily n=1 Tax=Litoreibacter albidus TaxID=670155 RepID=A0A1H2RDR0_9RHOB|nr:DMT family transporter [Litoreibacter albidus]SDW17290.1 Permease of the drug/metabolite transporter (DMT) superfamily [Litoreibacter albidus]
MTPTHENRPAAIAFMLLASSLIAGTTLLAKVIGTGVAGDPLHPVQIAHGRFLFAWIAVAVTATVLRPKISAKHLKMHATRTLFGATGITLLFAAVAFIPLSDATAISFLNPVFAMILAIPLLGERVGPIRWAASAVALVGAVVLLRPGFITGGAPFNPMALLALCAAVSMGIEITIIKLLTGRESPLSILFINNSIGLALVTTALFFVWQVPTAQQWGALAGIGFMMAAAQTCFIQAMRRAEASFVVPFSYATLVFATLYDTVAFQTRPDGISLLGAGVIIAGAALLAWREGRAPRPLPPPPQDKP